MPAPGNITALILAGGFGILRVVTNIDEVTLQGFEIDAKYLVNSNLSLFGSVGVVDSEIDKNTNRPYTEGNDMPLTPDMTANIGAEWALLLKILSLNSIEMVDFNQLVAEQMK